MARANVVQVLINGTNATGPAFAGAAAGVAAFGAAVVAALAGATNTAAAFEHQIAEISTLLDGDTAESMKHVATEIRSLSREFGFATNELARANYDAISAGFIDIADSQTLLRESGKLATATNTTVAQSMDVLTTILNSYGDAAEASGKRTNTLWQIIQFGKTTGAELFPVLGRVSALASKAGVSFEELGSAIAAMTASGLKTDEAITALRGLLSALITPTKDAQKVFEELQLDLKDGLGPTLQKLGQLGETNLEKLAKAIPNVRALVGALTADYEKFNETLGIMSTRTDSLDGAFNKMQATTQTQLAILKQSLLDVARVIGDELLPVLNKAIEPILELTDVFQDLDIITIKWIAEMGILITTIIGLSAAAKGLHIAIGPIVAAFSALGPIGGIIAAVSVALALLVTRFNAVAGAAKDAREEFVRTAQIGDLSSRLQQIAGDLAKAKRELSAYLAENDGITATSFKWGTYTQNVARLRKTISDLQEQMGGLQKKTQEYYDAAGIGAIWQIRVMGKTFEEWEKAGEKTEEATQKLTKYQEVIRDLGNDLDDLNAHFDEPGIWDFDFDLEVMIRIREQLAKMSEALEEITAKPHWDQYNEDMANVIATLERMSTIGPTAILSLSNAFSRSLTGSIGQVTDALVGLREEFPSVGRIFQLIIADMLRALTALIIKALIARAVLSFIPGFGQAQAATTAAAVAGAAATAGSASVSGGSTTSTERMTTGPTNIIQLEIQTFTPFSEEDYRQVGESAGQGLIAAQAYSF